jgi:hypothetical protein
VLEGEECRVPFTLKSDETSVLLLSFSTPLSLTSLDISLSDSSVDFNLRPSDSFSHYFLDLQFNTNAAHTLDLSIDYQVTDLQGVPVSQAQHQVQFSLPKADQSSSTTPQSASQVSSAAIFAGAALTGMLVGSPQSMFLLLNTLQFASLIPLMDFSTSKDLSTLLIGNNPFTLIPNLSTTAIRPGWFADPYSKAEDYGFETAGFIYNIGQELSVLAVLVLVLLGLYLGSKFGCCCSSLQLFCAKKLRAFKESLLPGYLQGNLLELLVSAMVQLKSQKYTPIIAAFSCLFAWMFVCCALLYALTLLYLSFKGPSSTKLSSFFTGLSGLERLQVPAFYVHRLLCVLVVTLCQDSLVQGFVCLGACLLVM